MVPSLLLLSVIAVVVAKLIAIVVLSNAKVLAILSVVRVVSIEILIIISKVILSLTPLRPADPLSKPQPVSLVIVITVVVIRRRQISLRGRTVFKKIFLILINIKVFLPWKTVSSLPGLILYFIVVMLGEVMFMFMVMVMNMVMVSLISLVYISLKQ